MSLKNILMFILIWATKLLFPKYWKLPTSVVFAQSAHETGFFQSSLAVEHNNLFGMKIPRARDNHTGSTQSGFAIYKSKFKSVYDYFQRQMGFNIVYQSNEQYMTDTQDSNYSDGSSTYVQHWKTILEAKGVTSVLWVRWLAIGLLACIPFGLLTYAYFKLWGSKKSKKKAKK